MPRPPFHNGANLICRRQRVRLDGTARSRHLAVNAQHPDPSNLIGSVLTSFAQDPPQVVDSFDLLPAQLVFERSHLLDSLQKSLISREAGGDVAIGEDRIGKKQNRDPGADGRGRLEPQ